MPDGKPAGVPCIHLDKNFACELIGKANRPAFCGALKPEPLMCGESRIQALEYLGKLEDLTGPGR